MPARSISRADAAALQLPRGIEIRPPGAAASGLSRMRPSIRARAAAQCRNRRGAQGRITSRWSRPGQLGAIIRTGLGRAAQLRRYTPLAAALFFSNIMNMSRIPSKSCARVLAREASSERTWVEKQYLIEAAPPVTQHSCRRCEMASPDACEGPINSKGVEHLFEHPLATARTNDDPTGQPALLRG